MFKLFKQAKVQNVANWRRHWSNKGIVLTRKVEKSSVPVDASFFDAYLTQLTDDGLVDDAEDGFLLSWSSVYDVLAREDYGPLRDILGIPSFTEFRLNLRSSNSLADPEFSIAIDGWRIDGGSEFKGTLTGPIMSGGVTETMMSPAQWALFNAVVEFSRRSDEERSDLSNRQGWGHIRKLALDAGAKLDDFLYRSVVLSPERLKIGLRRSVEVADDHVVEIEPSFDGAPDDWLDAFDRVRDVRERYDITTHEGIVQILVAPKVKTVLREIKRLPGRRVAGSRAQAFLLNPYAALGADAIDVIEEAQFESAREAAGLDYERFVPTFERNVTGYPLRVGLLVESTVAGGPTSVSGRSSHLASDIGV
ncbi:hypothetical protein [Robbsia andropogonis]|uniref:hypothetical protein n=1 Tax=Robbsia andropogonis TaxID=28092 RepID=UPI00209ED5A1|nr:hypothetical protein [Robbsia andropogonis]MCP1118904.1 hypothetical protein [Robbsia andropogonis]MCP1128744.1 hypothetical protein [Robbsia andropogonis]